MTDKPSYLGLLNAIAVGERGGEQLFDAWACATTNDDVRAVLRTVALREGEHARSFAKRIDELGFSVLDRPDADLPRRLELAASTTVSDREKFERLGFARAPEGRDVFAGFFDDTTMDIETGTLMGRYVSEERDTGRRLRACYAALVAAEPASPAPATTTTDDLSARLDRIEQTLESLAKATTKARKSAKK